MHTDQKLVRLIKHGSQKAADELFDRYYREIYAYIYRQCGERELAMDLTQDTFVAAFRGMYGFDGRKAEFRTWLYHIAANKVTDYYRSRRYHQHIIEQPLDEMEYAEDYDILKGLEERERVRQIMELVSGYEPAWAQIFQKKCFEEKTFAEIAIELDISENTVKTRYYTIIRRLRKEFLNEDRLSE